MQPVRIKMTRLDDQPGMFRMRIDWVADSGRACTMFHTGTAAECKEKREEILASMHDSKKD